MNNKVRTYGEFGLDDSEIFFADTKFHFKQKHVVYQIATHKALRHWTLDALRLPSCVLLFVMLPYHVYVYIYIYIYLFIYLFIYLYIYIYILYFCLFIISADCFQSRT